MDEAPLNHYRQSRQSPRKAERQHPELRKAQIYYQQISLAQKLEILELHEEMI